MSHQVVYRKYRSQDFIELIGQEHIVETLSTQIQTDSIGHAYLFFGPRGCGKTSTARIMAKTVNCLKPLSTNSILIPCGVCESCVSFTTDDMDIVEMDAASNRGIDDARLLKDKVYSQPLSHKYKVIILDEAHMLTREAVNALLKIIEEPPHYMIFIFCTTEFNKIPITIASRCQRFKFHLASKELLIKKLKYICSNENKEISDEDLNIIANLAKGSFRDAESLLEQILYSQNSNFINELFSIYKDSDFVQKFSKAILSKDLKQIWDLLVENEKSQRDVKQLLDITLEQITLDLNESRIKFDDYIELIKVIGAFKTGGKEELIYIINKNFDKKSPLLTKNEDLAIVAESASIQKIQGDAKQIDVSEKNNSKSLINPSTENKSINQKNEHNTTTSNVKVLNEKEILSIFKDKSGVYNILTKSSININGKIVSIGVSSTVSKLLLVKNKIDTAIISDFEGMVDSVKIEVVKNDPTATSTHSEVKSKEVIENAEKIFGAKFE